MSDLTDFSLLGGWGFTVEMACDLAWICMWRNTPEGRVEFPIGMAVVVPENGGEGRPAFEIHCGDPFVQVFADAEFNHAGYIDIYVDRANVLVESTLDYPGTTKEENE